MIDLHTIAKPNNCFVLPDKNILLVLSKRIHLYNHELVIQKEIMLDDIHPRASFFSVAKPAWIDKGNI